MDVLQVGVAGSSAQARAAARLNASYDDDVVAVDDVDDDDVTNDDVTADATARRITETRRPAARSKYLCSTYVLLIANNYQCISYRT